MKQQNKSILVWSLIVMFCKHADFCAILRFSILCKPKSKETGKFLKEFEKEKNNNRLKKIDNVVYQLSNILMLILQNKGKILN